MLSVYGIEAVCFIFYICYFIWNPRDRVSFCFYSPKPFKLLQVIIRYRIELDINSAFKMLRATWENWELEDEYSSLGGWKSQHWENTREPWASSEEGFLSWILKDEEVSARQRDNLNKGLESLESNSLGWLGPFFTWPDGHSETVSILFPRKQWDHKNYIIAWCSPPPSLLGNLLALIKADARNGWSQHKQYEPSSGNASTFETKDG
jgi:hypothetical protein